MSQENLEVVRRGWEEAARGDFDRIAELLAPDVKWHGGDPEYEGSCHNRGEALAFMRGAYRQRRIGQLVDAIDAGDSVVVVLQPPPEDGVTPPRRANVTTFRDGQVVEMIAFETPEDALAHVGLSGHKPDISG